MANIKIYIPTFISDQNFTPARVNPRAFFYNGTLDCEPFLIEANEGGVISQTSIPSFPYFDHYSLEPGGTEPGPSSNSLLFLNENAVYGTPPTSSLYDGYWEKYVSLLYDPATRLLDASAIISLADYNEMELNDIVQFRGNYFHLRAINEYDVKDGTCKIQLLGPILNDTLNIQQPINCEFDFTAVPFSGTTTTTTTIAPTTTTTSTTTVAPYTVDYFILAGGGGGGSTVGGGGGAGGYISGSTTVVSSSYPIVIGAGGALEFNGNDSTAFTLTAIGGGAGGYGTSVGSRDGFDGGSGGGGTGEIDSAGGASTTGQGFDGGNGKILVGSSTNAGGGGGATELGEDGTTQSSGFPGDGGNGTTWLNGITYAGGGGGGYSGQVDVSRKALGGTGGGGNGAVDGAISATAGEINKGAGGGGAAKTWSGGAGGSGVVIIRYLGTPKGTGGTITESGGYTYHTFTASGTFTAGGYIPGPTTTTTTTTLTCSGIRYTNNVSSGYFPIPAVEWVDCNGNTNSATIPFGGSESFCYSEITYVASGITVEGPFPTC